MSKELNCLNCCIGDFKHSLCDCNNGICKEYKKIGRAEEFETEVLNRTKQKTGKWVKAVDDGVWSFTDAYAECDQCHKVTFNGWNMNYCPNCGADMRGANQND